MTHLSDFSYLDRLVCNCFILPFLLWFLFVDKKAHEDLLVNKKGSRKRFLILSFYLLSYVFGMTYDVLATQMKYEEGFVDTCLVEYGNDGNASEKIFRFPKAAFEAVKHDMDAPFAYAGPLYNNATFTNKKGNCGIKQTPTDMYEGVNSVRLPIIDTLWNLQCTLRNSAIFLMLGFFNYTVKEYFDKPCLKRWEVRAFTFYSYFSLGSYFVTPYLVMSPLLSTVSSQILWSIELYFASAFLFIANHRINMLLSQKLQEEKNYSNNGVSKLLESLYYVKTLNSFLAIVTVGEATGLFAINLDIVVEKWQHLYVSKLLTDIVSKMFNFFFIIEPIISVFIIYKPSFLHTKDIRNIVSSRVAPTPSKLQGSSFLGSFAISDGDNSLKTSPKSKKTGI